MSDKASVKIQTHGIDGAKVIINGKELEGVSAIHFSEVPGVSSELHITLRETNLTISGEVMEDSLVFSKCHTDPKGPPGVPGEPGHVTKEDVLEKLAEPLIEYLRDNYHPYTFVIVTDSRMAVAETVLSVPNSSID